MYDTIEAVEEYMPKDKPRYLMGVGTPGNIIESVARGVDFSTASCLHETEGMDICLHGAESSTSKMKNIWPTVSR